MQLPLDGWSYLENGADIAVLALPNLKAQLEAGGFAVTAISPQQFYVADWRLSSQEYRLGDPVHVVGMWYGATAHPQLIVRSGNIATGTVGPVQFPGGALAAYLVDVSVTRAMSGAPVYATRGRGWEETALVGVNHGYWPVVSSELDDLTAIPAVDRETAEQRMRRQILSEVERLNSRLAIVTPVHHLAELLKEHRLWLNPTEA